MKIRLEDQLPFVTVKLARGAQEIVLERVLLDSGSAATVFAVDELADLGIFPEDTDRIRRMVGIGGLELVVSKQGFPIQGLLGTDFFVQARMVLDFDLFETYRSPSEKSSQPR